MREKIQKIVRKHTGAQGMIEISVPDHEEHGHYSTNIALRLAQEKKKNPREEAEKLSKKLRDAKHGFWSGVKMFERVEIAGPGFVNMWLAPGVARAEFKKTWSSRRAIGLSRMGRGHTAIVEYSQPNIAKQMHVGHLRSTVIGDALANIHEAVGYKVIRWNYIGDWGTQFGKLIVAFKEWGSEAELNRSPISTMTRLYQEFHERAKSDESLVERARREFNKLEGGDEENRKLWKKFREESVKEFKDVYSRLGVEFGEWAGESAYQKDMERIPEELKERGLVERSEGALVVNLGEGKTPALIQKSDGTSLYLTRDIASLEDRVNRYDPAKILYVVSNEQTLHFSQLFAVAKKMNLGRDSELEHVKFGIMLDEEGKKFSTREGRGVALEELLSTVVWKAREIVDKKNPDLPEDKRQKIAEAVGIGALKYNDLKENRNSDIKFNWEQMLDLRGDTAPYLQYTYARIKSVLKKAGAPRGADSSYLSSDKGLSLMRKIFDFQHEIEHSAMTLYTNNLALYLYELAKLSNNFYENTPGIVRDENRKRKNARLILLSLSAEILYRGLGLLGIKTPEEI